MTFTAWAFSLLLATTTTAANPPLPYVGIDFRWMHGMAVNTNHASQHRSPPLASGQRLRTWEEGFRVAQQ